MNRFLKYIVLFFPIIVFLVFVFLLNKYYPNESVKLGNKGFFIFVGFLFGFWTLNRIKGYK